MIAFQTLRRPMEIEGIGLHSGRAVRVRLLPREACGLVFRRTDLAGKPLVAASVENIESTLHATTLRAGEAVISTPEHLLAAFYAYGITHGEIELDGPEVPILDGSARQWCELLERAEIRTLSGARPEYALREPVMVSHGDGCVIGLPFARLRVTADVEYGISYLETQVAACEVTAQSFRDELAPARTFTLGDWIEPLRAQGLIQGGSTENALVLWPNEASSALRFSNELARHKAIDTLGDIALLFGQNGGVLQAHLIAVRAGHELHRLWMHEARRCDALILRPHAK